MLTRIMTAACPCIYTYCHSQPCRTYIHLHP